jgi:tetratricopeptide (TPR) repeat protein
MTKIQMRKTINCATIVFCFFLANCAASRSRDAQGKFTLGEEAFIGERYDEAIEHLTSYLISKPGDADAHLKLGLAFLKKGSLQEAIDEFKKSLALNQNNNQALSLIKKSIMEEVTLFLNQGKNDVAMRYLTAHLTINPNDIDTHILLAKEFIKMGSTRNALMSLNKAVSLDPKNPEVVELLDYYADGFH